MLAQSEAREEEAIARLQLMEVQSAREVALVKKEVMMLLRTFNFGGRQCNLFWSAPFLWHCDVFMVPRRTGPRGGQWLSCGGGACRGILFFRARSDVLLLCVLCVGLRREVIAKLCYFFLLYFPVLAECTLRGVAD